MRFGQLLVLFGLLAVPLTADAQRDSVTLRFDAVRDTVRSAQLLTIRIYPDHAVANASIDTVLLTLNYVEDLLNYVGIAPPNCSIGPRTITGREASLPISIVGNNLSLDPAIPLVSLTFEGMVTDTVYSQLRLTDLSVNPKDPSYSAIVLGSDTGSVCLRDICANLTLRKFLRGVSLTTVYGVSPNPTRDEIRVALSNSGDRTSAIQMAIFDALGNLVLAPSAPSPKLSTHGGEQQISVDVSSLASGVYFLRLSCDGYVQTRRVNIER